MPDFTNTRVARPRFHFLARLRKRPQHLPYRDLFYIKRDLLDIKRDLFYIKRDLFYIKRTFTISKES